MSVPCIIEIEDIPYTPRRPYIFATLPRIGETVCLEWDGDRFPPYMVYGVRHVPDGVDNDLPAFTVLHVRKVPF